MLIKLRSFGLPKLSLKPRKPRRRKPEQPGKPLTKPAGSFVGWQLRPGSRSASGRRGLRLPSELATQFLRRIRTQYLTQKLALALSLSLSLSPEASLRSNSSVSWSMAGGMGRKVRAGKVIIS
jgi:hypothetical protein